MSSVIQMMASVSDAAERDDSVEVGDADIEQVGVVEISATLTRSEGRRDARGHKGIYQGSVVEPSPFS